MKIKELLDIESRLIGCLITMPEKWADYGSILKGEYFSDEVNRAIFTTTLKMTNEGTTVNIVTAANEFRKTLTVDKVKDVISRLTNSCSDVSIFDPVSDYIDILRDEFVRRSVSRILTEETISATAETTGNDLASGIIDRLAKLIDTNEGDEKLLSASELVDFERKLYYEQSLLAEQGILIGVDTGLDSINDFTGGWQSELIVLAARPSMGKTACALFHGLKSEKPGIYINCEMSKTQLAQRLILHKSAGNVNGRRLKKRTLTEGERLEYEKAIGEVEKTELYTYYKPACGVHEAIRVIKRAHRNGKCDWVVIDYLQLLHLEGNKSQSREQEVSSIIKLLKRTQLELNIPIIVLAQLSRAVESRPSKKPILSDLRESGEIEQTADTVIMIWRPAYYNLQDDSGREYTNEVFYLFEKHRQGSVGAIEFRHNDTMTDFYDQMTSILPSMKPSALQPLKSFYEKDDWDRDDESF